MTRTRPTASSTPREPARDNETINALCGLAADRLDALLYDLGVRLTRRGKAYCGPCPIHAGSNPNSFSLYHDGYAVRGYWKCRSQHCHDHFRPTLLGLVRGVLSRDLYGWAGDGLGRMCPHREAVAWLCDFLKVSLADVAVDRRLSARSAFARDVDALVGPAPPVREVFCTERQIRRMCRIPAPHFLDLGYTAATLEAYRVGLVTDRRSGEFGRTIVPVFDAAGAEVVGLQSRSPHPKCPRCGLAHPAASACPGAEARGRFLRWKAVGPFTPTHYLYNLWRAREPILACRSAVLVEGAPDAWRLEEAGVRNALALFGNDVSPMQEQLLQDLLLAHITVLTDDDAGGDRAYEAVRRKFGRLAAVSRLRPLEGRKDVGEMTVAEVREHLTPAITSQMRRPA